MRQRAAGDDREPIAHLSHVQHMKQSGQKAGSGFLTRGRPQLAHMHVNGAFDGSGPDPRREDLVP